MLKKSLMSRVAFQALIGATLAGIGGGGALAQASTSSSTLNAFGQGWFTDNGGNNSGTGFGTTRNYFTGTDGAGRPVFRGWAAFDIPTSVVGNSATLRINTRGIFGDPEVTLWSLDLPVSGIIGARDATALNYFDDLGSGTQYGSRTFSTAEAEQSRDISLNASAWSAITAASGSVWGIGFSVPVASSAPGAPAIGVFAGSGNRVQLLFSTVSTSSDITGTGTFLTSGLGTSVNPVFAGGTLTASDSGTITQNFTVTGAAGSTINSNGSTPFFSGNFTNATAGVPGSLTIIGAGTTQLGGNVGSQTDRLGTLTVNGRAILRGTGTMWFNQIVNTGFISILQGATVHDDLVNTGLFFNEGAYFAAVNNSTAAGVITNAATGVWTGNVLSNTTGASITNNGTWVGSANNAATLINAGIWNSATGTNSTITTSGTFTNQSTGVVNAVLTVTGGTATNAGTLNSGATVQAGATLTSTGTLRSALTNSGTANMAGTAQGQMNNSGTFNVTGDLASNTSNFVNSGTGRLNVTGGNYTGLNNINNNSTAVNGINVAAGRTLSAVIITNSATSSISNAGTITTSNRLDNNGTLTSTGTINGGIFGLRSFAFSTANVSGTVNGNITTAGTFNITGNLTHNNGTLTGGGNFSNFGTLNLTGATLTTGQLTNFEGATTNAAGAINGQVDNGGTFNVTGNLTSNNTGFATSGIGVLNVSGGNYTGLSVVNHNSTAANGINVAAGRTLGASIITVGAGSSILNAGTITTSNRIDNSGTLNTTGTINGGTNGLRTLLGGTVNASGTINGLIDNQGTFNVTGNLASNGELRNSGAGRTTVNAGATWTGLTGITNSTAAADGVLINGTVTLAPNGALTGISGSSTRIAAGGTLNGRLTLNLGATGTNAGTISGLVSTFGTLNSTGQLLGGLTVNSGNGATANVSGTVNGAISNSSILNVTGNLSSNGLVTNASTGVITVNAGAAWTGTAIVNNTGTGVFNVNGSLSTGMFNNNNTAQLTIGAGGTLSGPGNVNNAATARITNGGTINSIVSNSGVVFSNASTSQLLAGLNNNAGGVVNLAGVANGTIGNTGTLTITGNLSSNNAFVNNPTAIATVNAGATWSGLTAVNNLARLTVNGTLSQANVLSNGNGAQLTVGATGLVQAIGGTSNFAGGTITNAGAFDQVVRNSGTLTSTGALRGGLTNNAGGVANLAGTANGAISNAGTLTVTANLTSNNTMTTAATGRTTINAGASWTGLTQFFNSATQVDGVLVNGTLSVTNFVINNPNANLRVAAGGTLNAGNMVNGVGATITNQGTVNVALTNSGSVTNAFGAVWNGALSQGTGSAVNNGTWDGYLLVDSGSSVTNNGTWLNTASFNSAVNNGTFTNTGTWTGIAITATSNTAFIVNSGIMNGGVNSSGGGRITNTGTINGLGSAISGGVFSNNATGVLGGSLFVLAGGTGTNAGRIDGRVTNSASFTSTGQLQGGLTNNAGGVANLAGTANGALSNAGTLTVTSALSSNGALANQGTGVATVNAGAAWTGLTGITNTSTNAAGITVNGTLSTTGLLANGAGSFVTVNNGGTLNAGNVTNAQGGRITVAQGGTINNALTNSGIVINAGAYNANVNNSGALAFITNETSGIWTGNVLSNASGGVINNNGIWNGTLNSVSTVSNNDNATWNGAFSLGVGSLTTNNGIWNTGSTTVSTVTDGTFINARTLSTGQVSVSGVSGLLINADTGVITINGANTLVASDGARISNNGTVNGAGSSSGTGSSVANNIGATWNGTFLVGASNFLSNGGSITGLVTNGGALISTGSLIAGLTNLEGSDAYLAGTVSGPIDNRGALFVSGNLFSNDALVNSGTGTTVVGAGQSWTGLTAITNTSTNAAGITVNGTLSTSGLVSNGAGSFITINAGGRLTAANVTNAEGGLITVRQGGTVIDALTNSGVVNNAGAYTADVANSGALAFIANQATGLWTGNLLSNTGGALVVNSGIWNGTASNAAGLINDTGATWTGALTNLAAGVVNNRGAWTGTTSNAGIVINFASGSMSGLVTNSGTFGSDGTVSAGLTNTGVALVEGTLNGAVDNSGSLTVTGNLASNGALANTGTGVVTVNTGAVWTGLTGVANSSSSTSGLQIAGTLNTVGNVNNGAGATIRVFTGGRLVAANVNNAATGQILVSQGGTVIDDLNNSGIVLNAGNYTANVNNTGAGAQISNLSTGVWNGNLLINSGGATVGNEGRWTGTASNAANLTNFVGASWIGALTNLATGITQNAGTWTGTVSNAGSLTNFATGTVSGLVTNTGTVNTAGTLGGGLTNTSTVNAQGTINGTIQNQSAGVITVTGALAGNGALTNSGTARLIVSGGNFTGLTAVTNASTNAQGIGIAATRTFSSVSLTNAAGATLINQGTLTTSAGTTNSGTLASSGVVNGALTNATSGVVQAQGTVSGAVTNAGQFVVTGTLAGAGAAFTNQATGQLVNLASSYSGLGAIANDTGGRIFLGTGTTNATLSGASMMNAGAIEMMNARVGDRVLLSGSFTGSGASRLSADIDMSTNTNQSDRIIGAASAGTTTVSIQNIGTSRIYFSQPIVLFSGTVGAGSFSAANDASTQAALSSNGIVDYSARTLLDGSGWGIVANVNSSRAGSIAADTMSFTNLADLGLRPTAESLTAGAPDAGQWAGRTWGRIGSSTQDVTATMTTSDLYATSGDVESELTSQSYSVGGSLRVFASAAGDLDVGLSAGQSDGKSVQDITGLTNRFEMQTYGAHAVFTGDRIRADLQYEKLDLTIDPANLITTGSLSGDGTRVRAGIGLPLAITHGTIEPYVRAERITVDIDTATLAGGLGTLAFGTQETDRVQAGIQTRIVIPMNNWTLTPSFDVHVTEEDGMGSTRFAAAGGATGVTLATPRDSTYWDADAGISLIHNASGLEVYGQATGRSGEDASGMGVVLGARVRF